MNSRKHIMKQLDESTVLWLKKWSGTLNEEYNDYYADAQLWMVSGNFLVDKYDRHSGKGRGWRIYVKAERQDLAMTRAFYKMDRSPSEMYSYRADPIDELPSRAKLDKLYQNAVYESFTGETNFYYNQELASVRSALRTAVNEAHRGIEVVQSQGGEDSDDQESLMVFKKLYDELSSILEEVELIYTSAGDRIRKKN